MFEQAGKLEAVAESEGAGYDLCRADRSFRQEHGFDDGACTKPHLRTGGADGHHYAFEHAGSRGPRADQ